MKKIFTALTLSAAIIGSASAQSAWTSHGEINKAPAQEAATRAAAGEIYIGHCSINDQIWPYDGLSLSYDARVGVGAILTEGMLKQYVGATIVGMYVGWDDEYSTANYECFVRADKFNGETLTTGSDEVQFGWNYVSLEEVTLTEDMKTLAVGFYTDLLKDVCSIPKLYPYGKENSNFLWSGETNANGEVWYDSKELGSMPIVLVLEECREHVGNGCAFRFARGIDGCKDNFCQELMRQPSASSVAFYYTCRFPVGQLIKKFTSWNTYLTHEQLVQVVGGQSFFGLFSFSSACSFSASDLLIW